MGREHRREVGDDGRIEFDDDRHLGNRRRGLQNGAVTARIGR